MSLRAHRSLLMLLAAGLTACSDSAPTGPTSTSRAGASVVSVDPAFQRVVARLVAEASSASSREQLTLEIPEGSRYALVVALNAAGDPILEGAARAGRSVVISPTSSIEALLFGLYAELVIDAETGSLVPALKESSAYLRMLKLVEANATAGRSYYDDPAFMRALQDLRNIASPAVTTTFRAALASTGEVRNFNQLKVSRNGVNSVEIANASTLAFSATAGAASVLVLPKDVNSLGGLSAQRETVTLSLGGEASQANGIRYTQLLTDFVFSVLGLNTTIGGGKLNQCVYDVLLPGVISWGADRANAASPQSLGDALGKILIDAAPSIRLCGARLGLGQLSAAIMKKIGPFLQAVDIAVFLLQNDAVLSDLSAALVGSPFTATVCRNPDGTYDPATPDLCEATLKVVAPAVVKAVTIFDPILYWSATCSMTLAYEVQGVGEIEWVAGSTSEWYQVNHQGYLGPYKVDYDPSWIFGDMTLRGGDTGTVPWWTAGGNDGNHPDSPPGADITITLYYKTRGLSAVKSVSFKTLCDAS
jgi:hypothetical protein